MMCPFKKLTVFLSFICVFSLNAQETLKIKPQDKLKNYLDFNGNLSGLVKVTDEDVRIYSSKKDVDQNKPYFLIGFDEAEDFVYLLKALPEEALILELKKKGAKKWTDEEKKRIRKLCLPNRNEEPLTPEKPLLGKRIAIDPGHIAGNFQTAFLERKYLRFSKKIYSALKSDSVLIAEGVLTFATAKILKHKLEELGAEVFLTRNENSTAFGVSYDEWYNNHRQGFFDSLLIKGKLAKEKAGVLTKKNKTELFHDFFKDQDLLKRAHLINQHRPDITIIIHYNVDEKNTNWIKPGKKNYSMAFIPGALDVHSMSSDAGKMNVLRLLMSDHLELSERASALTVKAFEEQLNVPIARSQDAEYLMKNCKSTKSKGVYCRNLALCRLIKSPLVYGECLYQDNENEYEVLAQTNKTYYGIKTNERVKQVADAYFNAILTYFLKN